MTVQTRTHRSTARSAFLALVAVLAVLGAILINGPRVAHAAHAMPRAGSAGHAQQAPLNQCGGTVHSQQVRGTTDNSWTTWEFNSGGDGYVNMTIQMKLFYQADVNNAYCGFMGAYILVQEPSTDIQRTVKIKINQEDNSNGTNHPWCDNLGFTVPGGQLTLHTYGGPTYGSWCQMAPSAIGCSTNYGIDAVAQIIGGTYDGATFVATDIPSSNVGQWCLPGA